MLDVGYAVQKLHGSEAKMHVNRQSRPEAGDSTQLMAALRQAHPSAAPQVSRNTVHAWASFNQLDATFHLQLSCRLHCKFEGYRPHLCTNECTAMLLCVVPADSVRQSCLI